MKEIKNIYGMPKKSWKRFCDSKNTIKQRRENKEVRKNRFKKDNTYRIGADLSQGDDFCALY